MNGFISIKEILDNLLDNPLLQDLTLERVVNYTVDFIRKVGMPKAYLDKTAELKVEEFRALLPCDLVSITQVKDKKHDVALRANTDNFYLSNKDSMNFTYKVQGRVIYTAMKNATIEVAFIAIPVDCDGYPMIVDNSSFKEALELYITKKRYKVLFDTGKLRGDVYNTTCQDYSFAVGQAQTSLIMPSIDEMQSISNMWCSILDRNSEHINGFSNNSSKAVLKVQ